MTHHNFSHTNHDTKFSNSHSSHQINQQNTWINQQIREIEQTDKLNKDRRQFQKQSKKDDQVKEKNTLKGTIFQGQVVDNNQAKEQIKDKIRMDSNVNDKIKNLFPKVQIPQGIEIRKQVKPKNEEIIRQAHYIKEKQSLQKNILPKKELSVKQQQKLRLQRQKEQEEARQLQELNRNRATLTKLQNMRIDEFLNERSEGNEKKIKLSSINQLVALQKNQNFREPINEVIDDDRTQEHISSNETEDGETHEKGQTNKNIIIAGNNHPELAFKKNNPKQELTQSDNAKLKQKEEQESNIRNRKILKVKEIPDDGKKKELNIDSNMATIKNKVIVESKPLQNIGTPISQINLEPKSIFQHYAASNQHNISSSTGEIFKIVVDQPLISNSFQSYKNTKDKQLSHSNNKIKPQIRISDFNRIEHFAEKQNFKDKNFNVAAHSFDSNVYLARIPSIFSHLNPNLTPITQPNNCPITNFTILKLYYLYINFNYPRFPQETQQYMYDTITRLIPQERFIDLMTDPSQAMTKFLSILFEHEIRYPCKKQFDSFYDYKLSMKSFGDLSQLQSRFVQLQAGKLRNRRSQNLTSTKMQDELIFCGMSQAEMEADYLTISQMPVEDFIKLCLKEYEGLREDISKVQKDMDSISQNFQKYRQLLKISKYQAVADQNLMIRMMKFLEKAQKLQSQIQNNLAKIDDEIELREPNLFGEDYIHEVTAIIGDYDDQVQKKVFDSSLENCLDASINLINRQPFQILKAYQLSWFDRLKHIKESVEGLEYQIKEIRRWEKIFSR